MKLNGAALPPALEESELFGHVRGACTGAMNRQLGRGIRFPECEFSGENRAMDHLVRTRMLGAWIHAFGSIRLKARLPVLSVPE